MNYSKISDFEINKMVGNIELSGNWFIKPSHPENPTGRWMYADNAEENSTVLPDYCNSWADAGPIIESNGISIARYGHGMWLASSGAYWVDGVEWQIDGETHQNPLRAAMIVFLMIREGGNG